MRNKINNLMVKKIALFIFPLIAVFLFTACTKENINQTLKDESIQESIEETSSILQVDDEGNTKFDNNVLSNFLNEATAAELSEEEVNGIKFMMEEEKLARDVYIRLYEKWNQQTFKNISESEETHIGAVRSLTEKYGIDIDFYNDEVGEFTDEKLLGLYIDLVAQGEESLIGALKVGALIEEIDILDLEEYVGQTKNNDISLVYDNLIRGSRNHLRSFVRTMSRQGQNYKPQLLGNSSYDEIINSENERGSGLGNVSGVGMKGSGQGKNSN